MKPRPVSERIHGVEDGDEGQAYAQPQSSQFILLGYSLRGRTQWYRLGSVVVLLKSSFGSLSLKTRGTLAWPDSADSVLKLLRRVSATQRRSGGGRSERASAENQSQQY